jgi:hypothetical protein
LESKALELDFNKRYQTMLTLWFALLMSVVMYFFVTVFAGAKIQSPAANPSSAILTIVLTAVGTFLVILSFAVKQKLLSRSVDNQDPGLVQKALVVACAMCEVAALLGLVERFVVGNKDYYLLFIVAAAGILLHFPKRSQLEAASFNQQKVVNGE